MPAASPYQQLVDRSRERTLLASCASLLAWDEQTYMPRQGADHRAEQLALLAGLVHEKATAPELDPLLREAEAQLDHADPLDPQAVNLREWRRDFDRAAKLPRALVEQLAAATSLGQQAWAEARQARRYNLFQPHLQTILHLKQQEAACLGIGPNDYDALLDDYEPGATAHDLVPLFETLRLALVPLIARLADAPHQPNLEILHQHFPIPRQQVFGEMMASAIGFDFQRGRLDVTAHPFCTEIGPGDCRITTRYEPNDLSDAFFSILHETGHALYEQGLDPAHHGTPMGQAVSLGVHESQSRLWENLVGRSHAFWQHTLPTAQRIFPDTLHSASLDSFVFAINRVAPSLIRVQADEVTYNLHIIIRFQLERALLSGDLPLSDLPTAWNSLYTQNLHVTPTHDAEGCLQDIHWSAGLFGYFPTYTLGNIAAAQLYQAAEAALGNLDHALAAGQFAPLLAWLRQHVHRHGKRFQPADLIAHATGRRPDPAPYIQALTDKYLSIYKV